MTYIRRQRHWKQKFDPAAEFVWRRSLTFGGRRVRAGDPVDKDSLVHDPRALLVKLRRLWNAEYIELANFDAPDATTGAVVTKEEREAPRVVRRAGPWYYVLHKGRELKANGIKALEALMKELSHDHAA